MGELDNGIQSRRQRNHLVIAQRPMVPAARTRSCSPHQRAPQDNQHVVANDSPPISHQRFRRSPCRHCCCRCSHASILLSEEVALYPLASSLARCVARFTALISVTRKPPSSSSRMPSTVHPAGVVTASFSSAGWYPVSSTIRAEPSVVCAASSVATSRGSPTLTPASASASMMMYRNAGPEPDSPVTASICFSSTTTVLPTV